MSALNFKTPPQLAFLLAAGAVLWIITRRANGQPLNFRSPLTPSTGVRAANGGFYVSPAVASQRQQPMASQAGIAGALGTLANKLFSKGGDYGPAPASSDPSSEAWRSTGNGLPPDTSVSDDAVVGTPPALGDPWQQVSAAAGSGDWGPAPSW